MTSQLCNHNYACRANVNKPIHNNRVELRCDTHIMWNFTVERLGEFPNNQFKFVECTQSFGQFQYYFPWKLVQYDTCMQNYSYLLWIIPISIFFQPSNRGYSRHYTSTRPLHWPRAHQCSQQSETLYQPLSQSRRIFTYYWALIGCCYYRKWPTLGNIYDVRYSTQPLCLPCEQSSRQRLGLTSHVMV